MKVKIVLLCLSFLMLFLPRVSADNPCDRFNDFCFDTWPDPSPAKGSIMFEIGTFLDYSILMDKRNPKSFNVDFRFYDPSTGVKNDGRLRISYYQTGEEAQNALYGLLMSCESPFLPPLRHKPDFAPGDVAFAGFSNAPGHLYGVYYCIGNVVVRGVGEEADIKALALTVEAIVKNTPPAAPDNPPGFIISDEFIRAFKYPRLSASAVEDTPAETPRVFTLCQNVPNPFNPSTVIGYELYESANVRLAVHDTAGRVVRVLENCMRDAGHHEVVWDGRDNSDRCAASGVYICRIGAGGTYKARKMTLVR
ncbi:hypothetical protein LLG96_07145 [bacterium]|nr:hypothetical protein [bacterium]